MTTPPMTNPDEALIVEQCDRALFIALFNIPERRHGDVLSGKMDASAEMQAIVHYRLSALKSQQARIEELEGALEAFVNARLPDDRGWSITQLTFKALPLACAALSTVKEGE